MSQVAITHVRQEVGGLVHVKPNTRDIDSIFSVEEPFKLAIPPALSIRCGPVGEGSGSGPNDTFVQVAVFVPEEDILLDTRLVRLIRIDRFVRCSAEDGGIDHDDKVSSLLLQCGDDVADLVKGETLGIEGLDPSFIHVIDVLKLSTLPL